MFLQKRPPLHLTYCLNVHPGETWAENLSAIREHVPAVRQAFGADRPFALGLRLSARAAGELADPLTRAAFRQMLERTGLYALTVNGFPYGRFHGQPVKREVYRPDWRTPQRRDYTMQLADILADLLPEGVVGSISTVPGAYAADIAGEQDIEAIATHLCDTAGHLAHLRERTGRHVILAIEPEPDCICETTGQLVAFWQEKLAPASPAARRHLGACLDTAHLAVKFENPAEAVATVTGAGMPLAKVQLSSALEVRPAEADRDAVAAFDESVYLHQVTARAADGEMRTCPDLPEALADWHAAGARGETWRIHCHVPLYWTGGDGLASTADGLDLAFWAKLTGGATTQLEVETYTFHVLPPDLRDGGVDACIARELVWAVERITGRSFHC
jgi:sugar phosphate isomerase/epimerase